MLCKVSLKKCLLKIKIWKTKIISISFFKFMCFLQFIANIIENMLNKEPEVDFSVTISGVTIFSPRFMEPRFIEWDVKGRCSKCKSSAVDLDFFVNGDGLELHSNRLNTPRYVAFDLPVPIPSDSYYKVRMKGHSYNIPSTHSYASLQTSEIPTTPSNASIQTILSEETKQEEETVPEKKIKLDEEKIIN